MLSVTIFSDTNKCFTQKKHPVLHTGPSKKMWKFPYIFNTEVRVPLFFQESHLLLFWNLNMSAWKLWWYLPHEYRTWQFSNKTSSEEDGVMLASTKVKFKVQGHKYFSVSENMVLKMWTPNGLRHDKTNKVTMHPAKTQISLGIHSVWSVFAEHTMGS